MEKKRFMLLKKLKAKETWRWRLFKGWRWKRLNFEMPLLNDFLFRIVSVFEAVALVSTLAFFFLCCGCSF